MESSSEEPENSKASEKSNEKKIIGEMMPSKLERCVKKVKKKGKVRNPYAVCKAALKKKKRK